MATAWVERRLVAILAADVVGYSQLVEMDEAGTLAALKALRREVIDPLLAEHHGRIVKLLGNGALAEFGSVVDALAFAEFRSVYGPDPQLDSDRQPSAGATCFRIASMTWALYSTPS